MPSTHQPGARDVHAEHEDEEGVGLHVEAGAEGGHGPGAARDPTVDGVEHEGDGREGDERPSVPGARVVPTASATRAATPQASTARVRVTRSAGQEVTSRGADEPAREERRTGAAPQASPTTQPAAPEPDAAVQARRAAPAHRRARRAGREGSPDAPRLHLTGRGLTKDAVVAAGVHRPI